MSQNPFETPEEKSEEEIKAEKIVSLQINIEDITRKYLSPDEETLRLLGKDPEAAREVMAKLTEARDRLEEPIEKYNRALAEMHLFVSGKNVPAHELVLAHGNPGEAIFPEMPKNTIKGGNDLMVEALVRFHKSQARVDKLKKELEAAQKE